MKKTILIGIAGGTGSGKTSVANAILAEFSSSEVALIQQDSYYHNLEHLHLDKRATVNFDHPDAVLAPAKRGREGSHSRPKRAHPDPDAARPRSLHLK